MLIIFNKGFKFELSKPGIHYLEESGSEAWMQIRAAQDADTKCTEVQFSRHSSCTEAILDFLNGEDLHMPEDVCPSRFQTELGFWGVSDEKIMPCCNRRYVSYFQDQALITIMDVGERKRAKIKETLIGYTKERGWKRIQAKVHIVMEYPEMSILAKVFHWISNCLVILSLFALVCSTHPDFQRKLSKEEWADYFTEEEYDFFSEYFDYDDDDDDDDDDDSNITIEFNATNFKLPSDVYAEMDFIYYIKLCLTAYFVVEFICKVVFFPLKWSEFFNFFNLVDLLALIVMLMSLIANELDAKEKYHESFHDVIHVMQVVRVFRLFRLVRQISGFKIMGYTLRASAIDIMAIFLGVLIAVVFFGSLGYFASDPEVPNIPIGMWWAIVTISTVGYGDVVPKSIQGKLVAVACTMSGILMLAIMIPMFVNNFILFYSHYSAIEKRHKNSLSLTLTSLKVRKPSWISPQK